MKYVCSGGVPHIFGKLSTRDTTLLQPSFNQRSTQEDMTLQNFESPNFGNFKTPNLGVLGQNDIWVQAPWLGTNNTIRGKVMTSPKFGLW
jgi:hypothetical protein